MTITDPSSHQGAPPRRVLVVDDDEDSAELLVALLITRGHDVRLALTGTHALDSLDQTPADVVLLDLGLPDMDGYDVSRSIRERFGETVRVVALTGFSGEDQRSTAAEAGVDVFLVKPVTVAQLDDVMGVSAR